MAKRMQTKYRSLSGCTYKASCIGLGITLPVWPYMWKSLSCFLFVAFTVTVTITVNFSVISAEGIDLSYFHVPLTDALWEDKRFRVFWKDNPINTFSGILLEWFHDHLFQLYVDNLIHVSSLKKRPYMYIYQPSNCYVCLFVRLFFFLIGYVLPQKIRVN